MENNAKKHQKFNLIFIKRMSESIKVFQNLYDNVIEFQSKEEFMNYYKKHQNEIDGMKTRGLNVKYKIPGFKIGRKQNQILLFPTDKKEETETEEIEKMHEIDEKINILNRRLKKMEETLVEILNYLKDMFNGDSEAPY